MKIWIIPVLFCLLMFSCAAPADDPNYPATRADIAQLQSIIQEQTKAINAQTDAINQLSKQSGELWDEVYKNSYTSDDESDGSEDLEEE